MIGLTLDYVDAMLLEEALDGLLSGNMSYAAHVLEADEAEHVAAKLRTAVVQHKCECQSPECDSYRFKVPEKSHEVKFFVVRLYVRGELLLHIDSDGDIYFVERLHDIKDNGTPRTIYAKQPDGSWAARANV